jgi:hypothetical protein
VTSVDKVCDIGGQGVLGTALAYTTILAGEVSPYSGSFNLTNANVTKPATGIYCFSGLPAGTNAVIAGPANLGTAANDIIVSASFDVPISSPRAPSTTTA